MKKILLAAIILLCMTSTGCFQEKFNLIITDDGAVVRNWRTIGTAPFSQQIETWKTNNEKLLPDLKVNPISEGDMFGYEFTISYPDIESFVRSPSEIFSAHAGKNKGVSRHKSWFFDEYEFDFYSKNDPITFSPEASAYMAQASLNNVIYEVTIQLPYSAESHNADKIEDGGKFLKWNLAPILIRGGEKSMQTRFKIWHKDKVALTAAIEILLLAATIFFFIKACAEESLDLSKDFLFKRNVFAGLFISLVVISAYLLLSPVNFTDADIISVAVQ